MTFSGLCSFRSIILQSPSTFPNQVQVSGCGEQVGTWLAGGPLAVAGDGEASSGHTKKACLLQPWESLPYASAQARGFTNTGHTLQNRMSVWACWVKLLWALLLAGEAAVP